MEMSLHFRFHSQAVHRQPTIHPQSVVNDDVDKARWARVVSVITTVSDRFAGILSSSKHRTTPKSMDGLDPC